LSAADCIARIDQIRTMIEVQPAATAKTSTVTPTAVTDFATALKKALKPDSTAAAATPTSDVTGTNILDQAKKYLGVPYVFGGEDASGMDCSGLVQRVLEDLGYKDVPRLVSGQAKLGTPVGSLKDAQPGDLITLKDNSHIVIYAGDGKILHAPKPGDHVKIANNWISESMVGSIRRVAPAVKPADIATETDGLVQSINSLAAALTAKVSATGAPSAGLNNAAMSQYNSIAALLGVTL
jgi:cell wall-associated NlpC family hydrolase